MNFFTKIRELFRQKEQIAKKPNKHDANLQKNSTLYFQVGLIICLLATNGLFEMYFETKIPEVGTTEPLDEEMYVSEILIEKKVIAMVKPEPKTVIKPKRLIEPPIIKDNDYVNKPEEPVIATPETPDVNPPVPVKKAPIPPKGPTGPRNVMAVEEVPIFPGCENVDGNNERIKCMSGKLAKIVQRKFDTDKAVDLGLNGKQRISVQFTIDKMGNVTDIKARAPHISLEKEAKRVMTKVPKMQPGKHGEKPVDVIYSLPIIFKVQD